MIYLLNSPILTSYGRFEFSGPLTIKQAKNILKRGFESAIGHQATADVLNTLLDIPMEVKRQTISMNVGDKAVIFRLLTRIEEGGVLSQQELLRLPFELSVLTKISEKNQ